MQVSIDGSTGQVTVRTTDDDGKEKVLTNRLDLPPDRPTAWFSRY